MTTLPRVHLRTGIQAQGEGLEFFDLGRGFLYREMHGLAGITDQFWKQLLPQIAHTDLGVHAACVVLGTAVMHRRYRTDDRFSIVGKYYGRAIQQIQHDLATRPTEVSNIACMCFLLVMTDLLLDRHVQALSHLQGALALLHSRQQNSSPDGAITLASVPIQNSDFALIDVIDIAALSLDISVSSYASELPPRLPSPKAFDDSSFPWLKGQELRTLGVLHSAYEFLNRASTFKYVPIRFHPQDLDIDHGRHIANLISTTHALSFAIGQHSAQENRRLLILRMQFHSCLIRLATILCPEECIYDTYTEVFRCIIEDARLVMSGEPRVPVNRELLISADLGLVQPLSFTAMKCRDFDIRSAAIALLNGCGTDGPFDAKVLAAISRRVIELEMSRYELTQVSAHSLSDLVPERLRICGCGPDLSQVRQVGDPQVTAFFSRCVDISAMMAEQTADGFGKSAHWQIWTEAITVGEAWNV